MFSRRQAQFSISTTALVVLTSTTAQGSHKAQPASNNNNSNNNKISQTFLFTSRRHFSSTFTPSGTATTSAVHLSNIRRQVALHPNSSNNHNAYYSYNRHGGSSNSSSILSGTVALQTAARAYSQSALHLTALRLKSSSSGADGPESNQTDHINEDNNNNNEDNNSNGSNTADKGAMQKTKQTGSGEDEGHENEFVDETVIVKDDKGNSITRIKVEPLSLIEEVPLPQRVYTDLELIMMAWSEEHARHYAFLLMIIRFSVFVLLSIILYVFYRTQLSSERTLRGVNNVPRDLRIGNVVYFDIAEEGKEVGRVVIGLLNENCPLYCEYFHRKCTGSGDNDPGSSFRGLRLTALVPRHALVFGEGREMTHEVPGFDPHYLPTEYLGKGAWRGALSSIAYGPDRESPNFAIHISAGDYHPQIFAIILGGYDVIERINAAGCKHGNTPKRNYTVVNCGELCTLAKSHIVPMPWKLYQNVSNGYDEEKFGPKLSPSFLEESDARGAAVLKKKEAAAKKKRFFFF